MAPNAWDEDRATIQAFAKREGLTYRLLLNGSRVQSSYQLMSLPTLLWIDRAGMIRDLDIGFSGVELIEQKTKRLVEQD